MDNTKLMELLGPEGFKQLYQQSMQSSTPPIDVPTQVEPPPVLLHGELKLVATFPYNGIVGIKYDQIVQKVLDVLAGQQGPWLPRVEVGELRLWRPVTETAPPPAAPVPEPITEFIPDEDSGDDAPYEPGGGE